MTGANDGMKDAVFLMMETNAFGTDSVRCTMDSTFRMTVAGAT